MLVEKTWKPNALSNALRSSLWGSYLGKFSENTGICMKPSISMRIPTLQKLQKLQKIEDLGLSQGLSFQTRCTLVHTLCLLMTF